MSKLTNAQLINLATEDLSPQWKTRISDASSDYWELQKVLITSNAFSPARNEVITSLINRIGLTTIAELEATNPFRALWRSSGLLFGDTIQEMEVDNVQERKFQNVTSPVDQFKPEDMRVNAAYHKINRESQYPITLRGPQLARAFVNEGGLSQLLAQFVSALSSSNEIDSYIWAKKLIASSYNQQDVKLKSTQFVEMPNLHEGSTNEEVRAFLYRCKNILSAMCFNSNAYKISDVIKAYPARDFIMFLDYRFSNLNAIQNLPTLFTPQYNSLGIEEILVDNFGDGGENICGVICHKNAFNVETVQDVTTNADNAASLYQNWFRTLFEIYWMSPFFPVVFLTKSSNT